MSYVSIGVNIIAGLLYTPWMIHTIGRENYGLFTLAMSVISLFLFDFGLSSAVTRFISKYLAEGNQDKANDCLGLVYRLYFGLDVILFLVLASVYFFIPQIYQQLSPDEVEKFKALYAMVALYSILSFPFIPVNGALIAHERFIQLKLCEIISRVLTVTIMTICLFLGYGLYAMVMVNSGVGLFMIALKLFCIKKYTPQRITLNYRNKSELKEIAGYSGWITIIALAQRCIFNIAPSILGALSGSTAIAILGIAITLEGFAFTFANAFSGMFLPKVSRLYASGADILPLMIKVGRIQIFIMSLVVSGFVFIGQDFIRIWVGNQFKASYYCALLIIAPSLLQLPQEIGVQAIIAKNKVKQQALVFLGMAVLNIIGATILSPIYGAVGLSCSICIAYIVRTIGLDYVLIKELNINIWRFFKESFIKMLPAIVLVMIFGFFMKKIIFIGGWLGLFISCAIYVTAYILIMYLLGMNAYERSLLASPIKRICKKNKVLYENSTSKLCVPKGQHGKNSI